MLCLFLLNAVQTSVGYVTFAVSLLTVLHHLFQTKHLAPTLLTFCSLLVLDTWLKSSIKLIGTWMSGYSIFIGHNGNCFHQLRLCGCLIQFNWKDFVRSWTVVWHLVWTSSTGELVNLYLCKGLFLTSALFDATCKS